jgi:hypothetical protein
VVEADRALELAMTEADRALELARTEVDALIDRKLELVRTYTISMDLIERLAIFGANVVLLETDGGDIMVKEFLKENNSKYYASVESHGNSLTVSRDDSLFHNNSSFSVSDTRTELYIPKIFADNLTVDIERGSLSAGNYDMNDRNISMSVSAGNITMGHVGGALNVHSNAAIVTVGDFNGNGEFYRSASAINLALHNMTSDVSIFGNAGAINLVIDKNISFALNATANVSTGNILGRRFIATPPGTTVIRRTIGRDPKHTLWVDYSAGTLVVR